jgi:predicted nucleic acid-binding protein
MPRPRQRPERLVAAPLYLFDTNVFREMGSRGNAQVRAWLGTINDDQIRVSPVVYREMRQGWERELQRRKQAHKPVDDVEKKLADLDRFEKDYAEREVPITMRVERELAKLVGAKGKNERDMILAATARVHDLVLVTRNVKDFEGRGVRLLNPFTKVPKVETV